MAKTFRTAATLAALALTAGSMTAAGQTIPTAVYTAFNPANNTVVAPLGGQQAFESFNGLHRSPNGQRWLLVANTDAATNIDQVMIAGQGTTRTLVAQQGQPVPGVAGRTINIMDDHRINDAGQFAFESNTSGTGNPSLCFYFGTLTPAVSFSVVAGGGVAIPTIPGSTYAGGYFGTLLDNTGRYGFQTGLDLSNNAALFFDGAVIAKISDPATAPTLLNAPLTDTWASFIQRRMFVNAAGTQFLVLGTGSAVGDIVTLNNVAIAQEGQPLPNSGIDAPLDSVSSCWMEPGGRWFVRAIINDNAAAAMRTDVVMSNGAVIARRGSPVIPGSTLLWDRVNGTSAFSGFLFNVGNDVGDYAVAGWTFDGTSRRPVVVLNGETIIAMGGITGGAPGDAVDADDNGFLDDNATIASFKSEVGQGTAFLTNSGELWMNLNVVHAGGTDEAVVRMQLSLSEPCVADFNGDGSATIDDLFLYLNAYFSNCTGQAGPPCNGLSADVNGGGVTIDDLFLFLNAYFTGCP